MRAEDLARLVSEIEWCQMWLCLLAAEGLIIMFVLQLIHNKMK